MQDSSRAMELKIINILILATSFSFKAAGEGKGISHVRPCPSGYQYKTKCYRLGVESTFLAIENCDRLQIESKEENEYLKNMLQELGLRSVWIYVQYRAKYTNYEGYMRSCYSLRDNGEWRGHMYSKCEKLVKQPVCTSKLDCQEGWIGDKCDKQCNCHNENCTRNQVRCKYGCKPGWTGRGCFQELATPKVEFYCFKYRSRYALSLFTDLKSTKITSIVSLGVDGHPINSEKYTRITNDVLLELSSEDLSSPFEPNFNERKVDETTFEWDFRFRQYEDVRMQTDTDIRVRCNFSDADEMFASTSLNYSESSLDTHAVTSFSSSYTTAELFFSDPTNADHVTNVRIGQPIRVTLLQQFVNVNNISAEDFEVKPFLSPRKCFATSPDKKIVKQLSDADGCPLEEELFERFERHRRKLITPGFTAFGLPGYSSMNVTCSVVTCTNVEDDRCVQSCRYPLNSRYARSAAEIKEEVVEDVSANVNIH